MLLFSHTDYRSFIRALVWRLLIDEFDLIFMLAIVRDAVGNRPYAFARDGPVRRTHGAYHETFEAHRQLVLQVREVLHRPVCVNISVTAVSIILEALKGMFFMEGIH